LETRGNWKDDKEEGPWEGYHENGQLMWSGNHKDGKIDGLWRYYKDDGKEQSYSPYCFENGEFVDCDD
jgi:antitoxin component YwqK of YwqJK toxin-antitoxin module